MAEPKRVPRWVKFSAGFVLIALTVWLWLDHAFRAPTVVPLLLQTQTASEFAENRIDSNADLLVGKEAAANAKSDDTLIDCSSSDSAKQQVESFVDTAFGAELTELVLSGAISWAESHPPTLKSAWAGGNVIAPATYETYTESMLKLAADNGDAIAAAIFGAREVIAAGNRNKIADGIFQSHITDAERYLQQGIQANVDGALKFFWLAAQFRAQRSFNGGKDGDKPGYTDREAVIELHARTLVNQIYGTFEERTMAHLLIYVTNKQLPALQDEEKSLVRIRARQLQSQFSAIRTDRTPEEQRAENAIVAAAKKVANKIDAFDSLRCRDGRTLNEVLPADFGESLQARYKL